MRRLLHLYPGEGRVRRELLGRHRAWLAAHQIELILGDDWIAPADRSLYADAVLLPPAERVADVVVALAKAPALARLDGILLQTEASLPSGSLFAAPRGWPAPSPAAVLRTISKARTREALAATNVGQPAFALCSGRGEARAFAAAHGFPVILKPFASTMARLVVKVDDAQELDAAVERLQAALPHSLDVARLVEFARAAGLELGPDPTRHFLCESFAAGLPMEIDGFVGNGKARCFGALEQVQTPPPHLYFEGYLLPADLDFDRGRALCTTGERAVTALGLDHAGFSVELRATPHGPQVIEVNGRLGEDHGLWQLFAQAAGRDPFELAIAVALGESPDYRRLEGGPHERRHALAYRCHFGEHTVHGVAAAAARIAAIATMPALTAGLCVEPGDVMHAPPHPETFPHLAWVLASDANSSRAAFARARAAVATVEVELVPNTADATAPQAATHRASVASSVAIARNVAELVPALASGRPVLVARTPATLAVMGSAFPGWFEADDAGTLALARGRVDGDRALADRLQRYAARLAASGWREGMGGPPFVRLAEDAVAGLSAKAKSLPCRWFYDDVGSRLFEEIGATPEYYVTRAEDELLASHAHAIAAATPADATIVELGSGSAAKTQRLLAALLDQRATLRYVMIDISPTALAQSAATLRERFATLEVVAIAAEYGDGIAQLDAVAPGRKLVLWLGSNVGNFTRDAAAKFLAGVRARLARDDRLLLGADLRKDAATLEAAYDDAAGVTASFNLNLLARLNRELDGDFDLTAFRHRACWHANDGRVEMRLESLRAQEVHLDLLGARFDFAAGESIHTEDSWKYAPEELDALAANAGFEVATRWFDGERRFSENLLAPR